MARKNKITNLFRDIDLKFKMDDFGNDIATLSDEDAIKQSLFNLLMTKPNEVPFHPEIYSDLSDLLFSIRTGTTETLIKDSVERVVEKYEPRVNLKKVNVSFSQGNEAIDISIFFSLINDNFRDLELSLRMNSTTLS